jgi:hypothetical protein
MAREYTNRILEMNEEGLFDKNILIRDLLNWMSEADVQKFFYTSGFDGDLDEDDEDPMDNERDWGMEWYDTSMELA